MPKVSVITPVYNGERFIVEAIDSVLAQTLQDWELIIVNDGSTDGTLQVLSQYSDPRIRVISQANGGEGVARNTGLDMAAGRYVAFLDADDLYLSNGLADMTGYLEGHSQYDMVYSDGVLCDLEKKPLMQLSQIREEAYQGHILEQLVVSNFVTVPVCCMVCRKAIESQHLRFDTSLRYGVDWDFWTQLALTARFGYTPALTCLYRVHGSNMTSAVTFRKRKADLLAGRVKIMNAEWFSGLSVDTRCRFFYNLLCGLLDEAPEQQWAMMQGPPFQAMPGHIQANLLRLVAGNHLRQRQYTAFAMDCLRQSVSLAPDNSKGYLLYRLASWSPSLAATALSTWRLVHDAQVSVRSLGKRKPKPVPAVLLPATE